MFKILNSWGVVHSVLGRLRKGAFEFFQLDIDGDCRLLKDAVPAYFKNDKVASTDEPVALVAYPPVIPKLEGEKKSVRAVSASFWDPSGEPEDRFRIQVDGCVRVYPDRCLL